MTKPRTASTHGSISGKTAQLLTLAGGAIFVVFLLFAIVQIMKSLDFSSIIFSFGKSLQTDQTGKTNILLVGVGGKGHDGGDLTDTIMVAGIDYKNKIVPMLSLPRDLFVETKQTGRSRINDVFFLGKSRYGAREGMNILKETVSKITNLPIQYYIKVDFDGFVRIVDNLGGIDIMVEEDIYDTQYPKDGTIYFETFALKAGLQHLDGATALKYARSRKTTSDFDRAKRQQQLLYALKEKALSLNILTNPGKIQELYSSVSESIETNLSLAEIIELARIAKDLGKESAVPLVINDDPNNCGGLTYTPAREYFGGASVLLFAGNDYDHVHLFVNTVFNNIKAVQKGQNEKIQVLNGTKVPGLAFEGLSLLSRFCLNTVYYGNAENRDLDQSTIYYKPGPEDEKPEVLSIISTLMPDIKILPGIPTVYLESEKRSDSTIVVELGRDYLNKRLEDPFKALKYLSTPQTSTQQATQETAQTATSTET